MNSKKPNKQDMLKFWAVICMVIDHIGLFFLPQFWAARAVGRFAFPIFAFYAGYNFKGRINQRVLLYGMLLYVYSVFIIFQGFIPANILISIAAGQLYLWIFDSKEDGKFSLYCHFIVLLMLWPWSRQYFEYGTVTFLIMIIGQYYKHGKLSAKQAAWFVVIPAALTSHILFGPRFDNMEYWTFLVTMYLLFCAIKNMDCEPSTHKHPLIRTISRNSLLIYAIHVAVIMLVWRYMVVAI